MATSKIKKGDNVVVIAGKDKGKEGKVLRVNLKDSTVLVEGVNMVKKHMKPGRQSQEGGIIKIETPIYVSKVQLVCPKCGKGTRVGYKLADGKKVRVCKKCGADV